MRIATEKELMLNVRTRLLMLVLVHVTEFTTNCCVPFPTVSVFCKTEDSMISSVLLYLDDKRKSVISYAIIFMVVLKKKYITNRIHCKL